MNRHLKDSLILLCIVGFFGLLSLRPAWISFLVIGVTVVLLLAVTYAAIFTFLPEDKK